MGDILAEMGFFYQPFISLNHTCPPSFLSTSHGSAGSCLPTAVRQEHAGALFTPLKQSLAEAGLLPAARLVECQALWRNQILSAVL